MPLQRRRNPNTINAQSPCAILHASCGKTCSFSRPHQKSDDWDCRLVTAGVYFEFVLHPLMGKQNKLFIRLQIHGFYITGIIHDRRDIWTNVHLYAKEILFGIITQMPFIRTWIIVTNSPETNQLGNDTAAYNYFQRGSYYNWLRWTSLDHSYRF